jgi:hypothetical protein
LPAGAAEGTFSGKILPKLKVETSRLRYHVYPDAERHRMQQGRMTHETQCSVSRTALAALEADVGAVTLAQALDLFVGDLQSAMAVLGTCLEQGDEGRARRTGHKIKGIFDQYGIRDRSSAAVNLATRGDLPWTSECTAAIASCRTAINDMQQVRASGWRVPM